MNGERDLGRIVEAMQIEQRPGEFVYATASSWPTDPSDIHAVIVEDEGIGVVTTVAEAKRRGWAFEFPAAWLTVSVHTALDGVGLTTALSRVLSDIGVPCNVLAGPRHDHLLVPTERAGEAIAALEAMSTVGP